MPVGGGGAVNLVRYTTQKTAKTKESKALSRGLQQQTAQQQQYAGFFFCDLIGCTWPTQTLNVPLSVCRTTPLAMRGAGCVGYRH